MSLDTQCDRCKGYFRNFTQVVRVGDKTRCVQCEQVVKAGADPSAMQACAITRDAIDQAMIGQLSVDRLAFDVLHFAES